ncbi:MAG: hypothetical protein F6K26_09605 [Moorea sp. SIO2I5]|nr:hypothetical protein [Moorena sp. SIO2I5]
MITRGAIDLWSRYAIDMHVTRGANAFIYQTLVKAGRVTEFNSPYSVVMSPKS